MKRGVLATACLLAAILTACVLAAGARAPITPDIWEIRVPTGGAGFTQAQLQAFSAVAPASGAASRAATVNAQGHAAVRALAVQTDELHAAVYGQTLLAGGFFLDTDVAEGRRVAVVSARLAQALFYTREAVGLSLEIDGMRYAVIGVVADVPAAFAQTRLPEVYIPRNVETAVETVALATALPRHAWLALLPEALALRAQNAAQIVSYAEAHALLFGLGSLLGVAALLLMAVRVCAAFFRLAVRGGSRRDVCRACAGVALLAAGAFVFRSDFALPPHYLPREQIFDFAHYLRLLLADARLCNTLSYADGGVLLRALLGRAALYTLLAAVCGAAALPAGLLLGRMRLKDAAAALALALPFGLVLGLGLCALAGFPFAVPWRAVGLLGALWGGFCGGAAQETPSNAG